MSLLESFRSALASTAGNRLRSLLTALGIIIGVASVVTVVGLIRGFSSIVSSQFDDMGANGLTVRAKNDFKDVLRGKLNKLRFSDVEELRVHATDVAALSPMFTLGSATLRVGNVNAYAQVIATTPVYQDVNRRYVAAGRFIGESDESAAKRVVVIGQKLIETLHLQGQAVGQYVQFNDEWFRIVGVMEKRGEIFGISQDEFVVVPYRTGRSLLGNEQQPEIVIGVKLQPDSDEKATRTQFARILRLSHRLKSSEKDDFEIVASDNLRKSFSALTESFTMIAIGVVGLSLLVGGVGIMNIMLVSVNERTREIGILKALGARRRDILGQFMMEAMLLSGTGGALGIAIGYALIGVTAALVPAFPTSALPAWMAALALFVSMTLGLLFGVIPASRAADLDPIESLRFE